MKGKIVENFRSKFEFDRIIRAYKTGVSRVIMGRRTLSEIARNRWADDGIILIRERWRIKNGEIISAAKAITIC
ncbi:MAG: hypothetical protein WC405_04640 [Syntrophales bacterium]